MHRIINTKNYKEFHKYVDNKPLQHEELIDIVRSNDTYFVKYVLAKKVNMHHVDRSGWSLLFWASVPVLPILLSNGLNVHQVDLNGWSVLFYAHPSVIPLLLKYGLNINQVDSRGRNALMGQYRFDSSCELICNGIDINCIDDFGETALTLAIANDNFKLVEVLLEKGAIGIQTTLYRSIKANMTVITDLTEQFRDLTMYKSFYELCNF